MMRSKLILTLNSKMDKETSVSETEHDTAVIVNLET